MNRLYIVCVLTLAAVILDILLLHSAKVSAESTTSTRVDRVVWDPTTTSASVQTLGHIVGFQCVERLNGSECFILSQIN